MADSSQPPALPEGERQLAEVLLTRALGEPAVVHAAEHVWDRDHVFRLHLASGRAVILKRKRGQGPASSQLFGDELAALDYLNAMPVPVAPRLLGADAQAGVLLMEDLGDGATLADSLMAAGRERVQAELIGYAEALGSLHAWSMGHASEAARLRARHGPRDGAGPRWRDAVHRGKEPHAKPVIGQRERLAGGQPRPDGRIQVARWGDDRPARPAAGGGLVFRQLACPL